MTFQHTLFKGETINTVYRVDGISYVDFNKAGSFVKVYVFDKCGNILATHEADNLSTAEAETIAEQLWKVAFKQHVKNFNWEANLPEYEN